MKSLFALLLLILSIQTFATTRGKYFDRAIFVILENKNYADVLRQPFFGQLAQNGALFSNFMALTHPSQGNYVALTSGSLYNVTSDNVYNLNVKNITDLLEAKGLTWKIYVEDYPENCFTGATNLNYARKHNPFISYLNIQKNPVRCANIVNADQFDQDVLNDALPNYAFYVPNNKNSGHDTTLAVADRWYSQKFGKHVANPRFIQNTILISTFDESEPRAPQNQIYTSIVGASVKTGSFTNNLTTYSLLRLIEDNWDLGSLTPNDANAPVIPNVWQ